MNKVRVLLVDDHSIVRIGLAALLGTDPFIEIVAEAEDAEQALQCHREHCPDITLMDIKMPGNSGLYALTAIRAEFPSARIIMLSTYNLEEPMLSAYEGGAMGYLVKSAGREDLISCIRQVLLGGRCFPATLRTLIKQPSISRLSPREQEALELIQLGYTNREIGLAMGVSENTAKFHVRSVLQKLGAADRTEAVAVGFSKGLLGMRV